MHNFVEIEPLRILLERLCANRPHPWGLLITFIELIKNHDYHFWEHDFVTCAPEIERFVINKTVYDTRLLIKFGKFSSKNTANSEF